MILKQGMESKEVKHLQSILYDMSLLADEPDGIFGPNTFDAVVRFQKDHGLNPDGLVGQKTLNALYDVMGKRAQSLEPELPEAGVMTMEWIIRDKTGVEAGYVYNPDDLGGETNHGITKAVADQRAGVLRAKFGWSGKMRDLTEEMAFYIYRVDYWDAQSLDEVHAVDPYIADKLFDIGINAGIKRSGWWFQELLRVLNKKQTLYADPALDGALGPNTVIAMRSCFAANGSKKAGWTLLKGLVCKQGVHYIDISLAREANETFTMGWMNRLDHNLKLYAQHYKFL